MKYIEADELISRFIKKHGYADNIDTNEVFETISEMPSADVVEVKHGYYIGEFDGYADGNPVYDIWRCSECDCVFEDWDEKPTYKFCLNCGADMRERKADNNGN